MQNSFFKRLVATVIASITGLALIAQPLAAVAYTESDAWFDFSANFNQATQTPVYNNGAQNPYGYNYGYGAVTISNLAVTSSTFNPALQSSVMVTFTINGTASYLSVVAQNVQTGTQTTIATENQPTSGYRSFSWNGTGLAAGAYIVKVIVTDLNGQSTSYTTTQVTITATTGTGTGTNPAVPVNNTYIVNKAVTVLPSVFSAGQTTTVTYDVNTTVLATIEVRPFASSATSTPIKSSYKQVVGAGTYTWSWDGTNDNGQAVASGDYIVSVNLYNSYDAVSTPVKVTFNNNGYVNPVNPCVNGYNYGYNCTLPCTNYAFGQCPVSGTVILNATATPTAYNPLSGQLQTSYYILGQAYVTVSIVDVYGAVLKTIKSSTSETATNVAYWNGITNYGSYVSNGEYRVRIVATANGQTDSKEVKFTVGSGINSTSLCAGFKDVKATSTYCNAVVEMQKQGVFTGYSDNTFRPYEPISRAQTVKVVMNALKYNVPLTGWYFDSAGFKDVFSGAWYTPYLAAARLYGVINGYDDKTFRPENTITRAELSKVFLEASNIAQLPVPCFEQPYKDNTKTKWYSKYACTAKYYSLVDATVDGKFAGNTEMTRGDVALMIYRAQQQGLMKNLPPKPQINLYAIQQYQFPFKAF
ncbi:S-layer homology domain-containing protein [Candidatus Gracilibacteria bacterium]|nr:S-layer homology domain-containing protein [Candidatus Gracilibacteria bacterium]